MTLFIVAIIAGFILLVWTSDRFVVGASAIARNLGVSPLIIGMTIVGLGTSSPEIFVSAIASWTDSPALGIGNAIGSNIANIALILGATAVITPLAVNSVTLKREFPILIVIMLVVLALLLDNYLGFMDGVILLTGVCVLLFGLVQLARHSRVSDPIHSEYEAEIPEHMPMRSATAWFVVGLIGLLISSRLLVWGAVNIAQAYGVSDLVIGLTIVAIGTSLPELAASVTSALKKEHDIAIGNIIGSNMFNLLVVLALPGIIAPSALPDMVLTRDFPIMFGLTVALIVMAYGFHGKGRLNRLEGFALLICFVVYQCLLFLSP